MNSTVWDLVVASWGMVVVVSRLARWMEMLGCLVWYIGVVGSFFRMSSPFARYQLRSSRCSSCSYKWLVDSYKLIDEVIHIIVGSLVAAKLLLEQLSDVVEYFFISFVLGEIFFVILYQLLDLFIQLFFRNLLAVDQLQVLLRVLRVVTLALIVFHELLHVLAALRCIRAPEVIDVHVRT